MENISVRANLRCMGMVCAEFLFDDADHYDVVTEILLGGEYAMTSLGAIH